MKMTVRFEFFLHWILTSYLVKAATKREIFFFRNPNPHNPGAGLDPVTSSGEYSQLTCGARCLDDFPACTSYLHNATTHLCSLAASPDALVASYRSGLGDLYVTCDTSLGYTLYTYGSTIACIEPRIKSGFKTNYTNAVAACNSNNGYIASVRTREKLQLLQSIMVDDTNWTFWVGMDDLALDGTYRWLEDDSVAFSVPPGVTRQETATSEMPGMWIPNEPNNYSESENCIQAKFSSVNNTYLLNDYRCESIARYPCEMRLDFT